MIADILILALGIVGGVAFTAILRWEAIRPGAFGQRHVVPRRDVEELERNFRLVVERLARYEKLT